MVDEFKSLKVGQIGDLPVTCRTNDGTELTLRLCVLRKNERESEKAIKKALKEAKRKQREIDPNTLELHRYIVLAASFSGNFLF